MPFQKQVASDSPMIPKANDFSRISKQMKALGIQLNPIKKTLSDHFKEALNKDIVKVRAEVPTLYSMGITEPAQMPDGTPYQKPTGEILQAVVKVVRPQLESTTVDAVMKITGPAIYDTLITETINLEKVPLLAALKFAQENPERCTITASGTDSCVITVKGVDKLPGVSTKIDLMPVEGFLDAVRTLEPGMRKELKSFFDIVLADVQVAIVAGPKPANNAEG